MTVVRSLSDYFKSLNSLLAVESWGTAGEAAKLLSVKGAHSQCKFLQIETAATEHRPVIDSVFDDLACLHLMVLHALSRNKFAQAFSTQAQIVQLFNDEILQKEKDQNWFMPIFYRVCTDLRLIARAADTKASRICDPEKSSYYEQAATFFMKCYRSCVNDVRADKDVTKRTAMLNLTNQLFRIYFRINKLNLLKPLIRAIDADAELYKRFSMADKVTYNYYLGRKAMFDSDLALSERSLSYAFRNCPEECTNNKRLILMYLIPVKMFLGHMPTTALLSQFQLEQFQVVVESVKDGNLKKLDEAFSLHEHFFVDCGIFLMLEKLKIITFRNLFKKVANIVASNQIPLESFMHALNWLGIDDIDEDELECIVANLIAEKKIKGYISHQHKKVVISKQSPFPPLSSVH